MKLRSPFGLLTQKEKSVHIISWTIGLIMINIPSWQVTIGNFHSDDHSLLVPSIYGLVFNVRIFYENARLTVVELKDDPRRFLKKSLLLLIVLSILEALLDILYFYFFYGQMPLIILTETIWGQLLMNGIFFYLPSFVFGFAKSWKSQIQEESNDRITIKDGNELVHLSSEALTHIESDGNYCIYHASKKYLVRQSLIQAESELPDYFVRCHKSFIVNSRLVDKQSYHEVSVRDYNIPIGRRYREALRSATS